MAAQQETLLTLELPYRERLTVQRSVFHGGDGPRVAVVSGIHGDELEGLYVIHLLAEWLGQLQQTRPDGLLGRAELYPALNPLGLDTLERSVPTHSVDLNRNFPGHKAGLLPQRLADVATQALEGADLVVDIHASNIYLREIPQVRINQEFAETLVPLARSMNLDVIWLHGALTVLEATLAHTLNSRQTPCLVVEMGVGMRITPQFADQVVTGILRTWQALGVLAADLNLPAIGHQPLVADENNVRYLNADTSGLFIPAIDHWTNVEQEQLLGRIVSPYLGTTLSEVRAPTPGILFTLREYPLVYEGSLMARILDVTPDQAAHGEGGA